MKEQVHFAAAGTRLVTVRTHKRLGKVARLPGWGWYQINRDNSCGEPCGMRLPCK